MPCWTVMIESALFYLDLAVFRCHISIHELLEAVFFILVPRSLNPDDVARASLASRLCLVHQPYAVVVVLSFQQTLDQKTMYSVGLAVARVAFSIARSTASHTSS